MAILGLILWWALRIFNLVIVVRIILDWVRAYNPSWRPKGVILIAAETVYILTDWIIKLLRRFVPPLRLGPIALDVGLILLFIIIGMLQSLVSIYLI